MDANAHRRRHRARTLLPIGPHTVQPPVVLAPMAGITNAPFRTLCREFSGGKGLFVSEMITTRALVERNEKTMQLIHFDATRDSRARSSCTASTRRPSARPSG